MNWNYLRIEKRILSFVLILVMSVSLLSGCGHSNDNAKKDMPVTKEEQKQEESVSVELAKANEVASTLVQNLEEAVSSQDMETAATVLEELSTQLNETQEHTRDWLSQQEKKAKSLEGDAKKMYDKRAKAFEETLAKSEEKTLETLAALQTAMEDNHEADVVRYTEELSKLLVTEEEPKTYGENLPNEVPTQEASEEEYVENTDATTTEAVVVEEPLLDKTAVAEASVEEEVLNTLVTEGDTALSASVTEKAEELGTPLAVYNYLKNNISYEYYYGSRKGATGTLDAMGGNDIDQASLFIAMLRHLGYQAEYVRGDILLTEEQALSLTGADTFHHAADVLAANGTPVTRLTQGEEIVYIRMEHVWVRAYVPYTDYRGAGNEAGDCLWIDLDTSIKAYEQVENIYDVMEEEGFRQEIDTTLDSGDVSGLETMFDAWEEKLTSMDLENVYARKRIILQETLSYLPLSLQYNVETEQATFTQVDNSEKDAISFEVNGEMLASYNASELHGKNILLSFQPASDADKAIYENYESIFDVPAYSVYMTPVLLVDDEVVAEGESYLHSTLGTKGTFTMHIRSGGKNTTVTNEITTGSMYAVTLDSQNITASDLQSVYDEVAALKDSATEDNVYSEAYLGKLLSLAGKLYFAQLDIADTMAAEVYGVNSVRTLSEGITGYEVKTGSLYGNVTNLSEGNLFIDIDTDAHNVVSLTGDTDAPRAYMMATGMLSSLYESTVWEEMTGHESVSTISILAQAQEEDIELLVIGKENVSTELEKLNTDETTRQTVKNAVNSGKIVTIPAEDVTMGNWNGTGYIILNPETGAGAYMITGGLNGGSTCDFIDSGFILTEMYLLLSLEGTVQSLVAMVEIMSSSMLFGGYGSMIFAYAGILYAVNSVVKICKHLANIMQFYYDYILNDSDENAKRFLEEMKAIFMDDFFKGLAQDAMFDYSNWAYKWIIAEVYIEKNNSIWSNHFILLCS